MPPQLSVIVYGRDIQGHAAECLGSLTEQPFPDAEVIVAAVGEQARRVAEEHAARDARIRPLPLPLPDGTPDAAARAAGAERAEAPWLHFLAAKDRLPPGALRTVADRVTAADPSVDMLLFDHVRSTWHTAAVPSADGPVLARAGRGPVDPADRPDLLRLAPLLGARALRTGFWRTHQEMFRGAGELFTACAALVLADRVACLDQVVLDDRRLRSASLPLPVADGAEGLVEPFEEVSRLMAERGAPGAARCVLHDVMVHEWLRVIAGGRLPPPLAEEFFHRAANAAARLRPPGHVRPEGVEGLRQSLLEQDAWGRYRALQAANRRRREVRSTVRARHRKLRATVRDHRYRRALARPADPRLAVFSAYWDRGVTCSPGAIAAKLGELAPEIHPVWVVSAGREPLLPPGTDHVVPGTRRYWEVMARATYLVNNVNFPNGVVKRPGAVHVQTHHGTPLKRMGLDQLPFPAASRGVNFRTLLARVDKWDYSVTANSHSTRMWERAYPSRYTPLEHGCPRNDVFYRAGAAEVRAVRERLGIAPGSRAVLYAPTHRDYEAGWTPRLDLAALSERLGEDTVLLVRGHYFYGQSLSPLTGLRARGRVIDVSAYEPVEDLALAADALVTDYSSIMFDYAGLDRPIVVFADDWEMYATTRGVYFDLMAEAPGPVARTQDELAEVFASGAWRETAATKARAAFRRRFCEFDDGLAAERVVRRVFLGTPESALPPVIPLDERTPAPTPEEADRR